MDTATRDRLYQLGLQAMVAEWDRQAQDPAATALSCAERLALLVDAQWLARTQRQYQRRLQEAPWTVAGHARRHRVACAAAMAHRRSPRAVGRNLDCPPSDGAHHRTHGHWQARSVVCIRPHGLSPQLAGALLSPAPVVYRMCFGPPARDLVSLAPTGSAMGLALPRRLGVVPHHRG